jgi:hypothetical protein
VYIAHQAKVLLNPPPPEVPILEELLENIGKASPVVKPTKYPQSTGHRRMLEISIMDPHFGMHAFKGESDQDWNLEMTGAAWLWAIESLVEAARMYGPFEYILFPFGNDYLHAEIFPAPKGNTHGTAGGTLQPEMDAWHHSIVYGERLAIEGIDVMASEAPVRVLQIPGNHDRYSAFNIGRVLNAWYRNDANVSVNAEPDPYKFDQFGTNLIGFEHGHSVAAIRLAALMANEWPEAWAATRYHEWHRGDQHRKGGGTPVQFEEQGVSIEHLPSLVPANGWHRLKGFNWQKRGAFAYGLILV